MNFTFLKIELVVSLTLSLLWCFSFLFYWLSRKEDKTYLWLIFLFAGNSLYAIGRLLQYTQLDVTLYPLISKLIITTGIIFIWSMTNFINAYINHETSPREKALLIFYVVAALFLIWFTDLILTDQLETRRLFDGDTYMGVLLGPLYPIGVVISYSIIFFLSIRILINHSKQHIEKYLLSGALFLVIGIGINDIITISYNLHWLQFFDISVVPFGFVYTYVLLSRHSKLYSRLETMVRERTNSLEQTNKDLRSQMHERERAENTLRESEKKYRLLIENANDAIFITQDQKIRYLNPKTEDITGYTRDELIKIPVDELIHPDDIEMVFNKYIEGLPVKNKRGTSTFRIIHRSGDVLWAQLNTVEINWEGKTASLNFLRDITQEKKMELQLSQSQKMEAVGTLAGGIAHEFNNILGIILGNAELASDDIPESDPAKEFVDEIYKASIRGRDIVKELLSYSQNSKGLQQPLNLPEIIKESLKYLRATIPTSIEYRQDIPEHCFEIIGDSTHIHQIMLNLYKNAADAINGEGLIELSIQNIEVMSSKHFFGQELTPDKYVKVEIKDSGKGISEENMARIFDPFFTTKDVGKGTGLGLPVVHGIIKKHKGFINIESEPGTGTNVTLYFPAIENAHPVKEHQSEALPPGTEKILFIDDEESVVIAISKRLTRLGYQVDSFTNPIDALSRFNDDPAGFDLVITDMAMPRMSGEKLTVEIHKIRKGIPVILCTGYSEKIDEKKAADLGINDYLMKPIKSETLAKAIRKVLDD